MSDSVFVQLKNRSWVLLFLYRYWATAAFNSFGGNSGCSTSLQTTPLTQTTGCRYLNIQTSARILGLSVHNPKAISEFIKKTIYRQVNMVISLARVSWTSLAKGLCLRPLQITQGCGVLPTAAAFLPLRLHFVSLFPFQGPAGVRGAPGLRGMKGRRVSTFHKLLVLLLFQPLE